MINTAWTTYVNAVRCFGLPLFTLAVWGAAPSPGAAGVAPETPRAGGEAVVAPDGALPESAGATGAQNPTILGKSLGEWQARWYQWRQRLTVRQGVDPALEEGDVDCSRGQTGPVWFLAGCTSTDAEPITCTSVRTNCVLPADKYVGLSLVNFAFFNDKTLDEDLSVREKRLILGPILDLACRVTATIDSNNVAFRYTIGRNQSPPFPSLYIRDKDDKPAADPETVIDGYFAVIPPLPKGRHDITLHGAVCDPATGDPFFESDVTYEDVLVE